MVLCEGGDSYAHFHFPLRKGSPIFGRGCFIYEAYSGMRGGKKISVVVESEIACTAQKEKILKACEKYQNIENKDFGLK